MTVYSLRMNFAVLCCFFVLCMNRVLSVTISAPPMQRKSIGESCTFRWNVTGYFTNYTINIYSTDSPTVLGPNTKHTFNRIEGIIALFIWNIQTTNAGHYSLLISTEPSTEENSITVLFVYGYPYIYTILAVGRNPAFEGDKMELNCSVTSNSLPAAYRTSMYYIWYNSWFGYLRNISSGPAMLQNGEVLTGYSIKNEGETLVIASAQYTDSSFYCSMQEEGSPYITSSYSYLNLEIYGKPYTYSVNPMNRKFNAALYSRVFLSFYYQSNPPLISYTNWSFVNASGSTTKYPVGSDPLTYHQFYLSFALNSVNLYGNYSVTLTNSNGSRTETFQVLPPGPPDGPSNFSVQYVTHSLVSLQWRCMWFNGDQQTVFVRLMDVAKNEEVETQNIPLAMDCYNSRYSTLFQSNIQPETNYEASIWSVNALGSSKVVKLATRTSKRFIFVTSSANISIMGNQATINFGIVDSTKAIFLLNASCCVEITTQCSNRTYIITNTDNQIIFDNLPTGNEYVFDFAVYDTDGYTYMYTMAIVKGVRVSRTAIDVGYSVPSTYTTGEKQNSQPVAVIVLAVLLGVAVLALICCLIGFHVCKCRHNSSQQSSAAQPPLPKRGKRDTRETSEYANAEDYCRPAVNLNPSKEDAFYTSLEESSDRAKKSSGGRPKQQFPQSSNEASVHQHDDYELEPNDDIFYTKLDGTLDRPQRNRYQ